MEDDFDVGAAVDEIGSGLGFDESPAPKEDDDVVLEVTAKDVTEASTPAPAAASETPLETPTDGTASTLASVDEPPKTWRKEASATWAALPSEAKSEILKREADIFKGIESYKVDATFGKSMKAAVQPYEEIMRANGLEPVATVQGMLRGHHTLATGTPEQKTALFRQMAKDYRIDLASLSETSGEPPYIDPSVAALQNELRGVQSQLAEVNQRRMQEVRNSISSEIDNFAKNPANPYFDEVAAEVATLLQKGVAGTLQEAYEKAVWLNPATRAKEAARTTAEATAKAQQELREREAKARKATAANVKASAKSGSATTPLGSLDDTLEAALSKIKARG